jgi:MFS family permease
MTLSDTETGRERASGNAERSRRPALQAAAEHSRRTAPSRAAFWLLAGIFCLMFCAAGAPTPLYGAYRAELRFSATTLTAVFAVYALVLLLTLLVFGSVSDYLGRRRVILAALVVSAGACAVFLAAHSVGLLFAARALQGVAVGTAIGALGAALIDLQPGGSGLAPLVTAAAPALGLGAGALGSSALAQYGPAPTRLVWWLLLGVSVAAAAGIGAMPEPGTRRAGVLASLRPRVGVPRQARDVRRRGAVSVRGVGAGRPVPVTRAVAGRAGDRPRGTCCGAACWSSCSPGSRPGPPSRSADSRRARRC